MNKKIEFQSLIEGKKMLHPKTLTKQNSCKTIELKLSNSSFTTEQKVIPTTLPIVRRLSIKSNLNKRSGSEKRLMKGSRSSAQLYEDPPVLLKKSYHNDRIYWKKRIGNLPLLVINFEGVAGDFFKPSLWSDEKASFIIREHFFSCIVSLKKEFFLVLILTYSRNITGELCRLIEKNGNNFDAIYLQRHRKWHARYIHDISSILDDFKITDLSNIITISAVGIESADIKERSGLERIYDQATSKIKKFLCYHAATCEKIIPITVLVPHIRLAYRQSYFNDIANFLLRLKKMDTNFFNVFEKYHSSEKISVKLSGSEEDISKETPAHQFIFFNCDHVPKLKSSASEFNIRIRKRAFKFLSIINK